MTPPVVTPTELRVWVATKLVNVLNHREHWATRAKRAKAQREAVALAVWSALRSPHGPGLAWTVKNPRAPKAITLTAFVARPMDDDGLAAACKAIRDGLIDARLIAGDGPEHKNQFTYGQVVDRAIKGQRGVEIAITLRDLEGGDRG